MAVYLAAALADALRLGLWAWAPYLGIFLWGYAYTALWGLREAAAAPGPA